MKKFIFFLSLVLVALTTMAVDRALPSSTSYYAFDRDPMGVNYSYLAYTGTTSDYLIPTTRDTMDFRYDTKASSLYDFDVVLTYDKIVGIDTTVTVQMLGRNSDNEIWTTISTNVSSVVSGVITQSIASSKTATVASYTITDPSHTTVGTTFTATVDTSRLKYYPAKNQVFPAITFTEGAQTITAAAQTITYNNKTHYRLLAIRCILTGNDSVGTGIKIKKVELKLWK